MVYQKM